MIDKKWKWVAKDGNGVIYFFEYRPIIAPPTWGFPGGFARTSEHLVHIEGDWKDSLHEIIHHEDGKIEFRKARPELKVDDPVLVSDDVDGPWVKAHFAGWSDFRIVVWVNGRTSFTSSDRFSWAYYKLP